MNLMQEVKNSRARESYWEVQHASGLRIFLYPKKDSHSTYAIFGTNYGSVDNTFRLAGEDAYTTVPNGIAHYLEHKMFENEDGTDSLLQFAKTGASANAYTTFDKTCYLFSCADHVYESLEILLDFVQKPYFTEQTVQKEQGIIGQEIRMYDDDPGWQVLFHLLQAMYQEHPVRIDIPGTVESIAQITPELLYQCYQTFYNLHNMALCVVGNFDPQRVLDVCDRLLKPAPDQKIERFFKPEPAGVQSHFVTAKASVVTPLFYYGFKEDARHPLTDEEEARTEILLEALCGASSPLYGSLLSQGLINEASFDCESFAGPGYASVLFSGESKDPKAVADAISRAIADVRQNGISPEAFARAKKVVYGRMLSGFNSVSSLANALVSAYFAGRSLFDTLEASAGATPEAVCARLDTELLPDRAVLSVIEPANQAGGKA